MKSVSRGPVINRMGPWQLALLLLCLFTFALYSLPTFFGEQPALGLHGGTALSVAEQQALQQADLSPQRTVTDAERQVLVFDSLAHQQAARQLLLQQGRDARQLTVEFHANAPQWLTRIGAAPIRLGLDLRGGSQLLIGVDTSGLVETHTRNLVERVRADLREHKLTGTQVQRSADGQVAITLPDVDSPAPWLEVLRPYTQGQPAPWALSRDGRTFRLTLTAEERLQLVRNAVSQNLSILKKRIEELGISEATVQQQGQTGIRIELPGVHNPKQARDVIGATASLAFHQVRADSGFTLPDHNGQAVGLQRQPVLGGDHIVDARAGNDEMGKPQVSITLDRQGGSQMSRFSRDHVGQAMATVFTEYQSAADGVLRAQNRVINVATIQTALGNQFRITGIDGQQQARELALLLRAGALTAPLQILEERSVGPSLGQQNIEAGFTALAMGMGGMMLFLLCWYRRFGWVAITALLANLLMQVGMLALLPGAVLTLPGIAGLVLTVGMAVDTHVLIFERIRDRVREGGSLANAIDFGYRSAFRTILDANITTLISAVVLYGIGTGPLQGFAITLMLGLISSMITGIWGTRALINPLWGRSTLKAVRI